MQWSGRVGTILLVLAAMLQLSAGLTGCEQLKQEAERHSRMLQEPVRIPKCTHSGEFEPVQCNSNSCWCVDEAGLELAGTRAQSHELINCSDPKPCAGPTCRMLCPHGFVMDESGCPKCECYDPCIELKCPGSLMCELEEATCSTPPCPPIPKCKRGRSLNDLCPSGEPLKITNTPRPFLCGLSPGKPQCPPLYQCMVNTGHDYGVCCPASFSLQKPGSCPIWDQNDPNNSITCGMKCNYDLECPSMQKCCETDVCGKHCSQPQDVTVCLQQKLLAELLSMNEKEGKGYIPQCSESTGEFEAKQCSRNGLVCWCVDSKGDKISGTMGPGAKVNCEKVSRTRGTGRSTSPSCDLNICAQVCEYGFKTGDDGCRTCECDNPCEGFTCGDGEECVAVKDDSCTDFLCPTLPVCRQKKAFMNLCGVSSPLVDAETGEAVECKINNTAINCPSNYECVSANDTDHGVCCISEGRPEQIQLDVCISEPEENCERLMPCQADNDCEEYSRCCFSDICGAVCMSTPVPEERPQTMCEYLRDFNDKMEGTREGMSLALPAPRCHPNGSYEAMQCSLHNGREECWCVDEFGSEIPHSRNNGSTNCASLREEISCLGLTCRLGCDYGFEIDPETRCPRCECRNPCDSIQCSLEEECQMVEVNCDDEFCPSVPACLPKKPGQCPYLIPMNSGSCDYECKSDNDCNSTSKCCSNGCGTQCIEPVLLTACQHQKAIVQHKAHEKGIPARQLYVPQCNDEDGSFEQIQCHPVSRQCWCVDEKGEELPGTRAPPDVQPSCSAPAECPELECEPCEHGHHMDQFGCQTCKCRNPCEDISCNGDGETCRLVKVSCIDRPCPPVPMCLPHKENPCLYGHPLLLKNTSKVMQCGPNGLQCPSSHKCHLSPFGEYAVCCPKPRDVCFEPKDEGFCNTANDSRWYFNAEKNKCEIFNFGGCGGNQNSFESEEICNTVCPVLSQCERLREKNQKMAEMYKKPTFIPNCNPDTGNWEPVQCLKHVGVCWCVNKIGEHVKGSLIRGDSPNCSSRQARRRMDVEEDTLAEELLREVSQLIAQEEYIPDVIVNEEDSIMFEDGFKTRCQAQKEKLSGANSAYSVECDAEGRFSPTQCYPRNSEKFPECWCVDEAGNQLPNTTTFQRGSKICLPTPVQAVDITLGFHGHFSRSLESKLETKIAKLLFDIGAKLKDNELRIEAQPDTIFINFSVIGSSKVDVSFFLEQMVKNEKLILNIGEGRAAKADITISRFTHRLADYDSNDIEYSDRIIALEHREIVSQSTVSMITPYQTAIIVLCVGSAFIICILVIVIILYKKKIASSELSESLNEKCAGLDQRFLAQAPPIYVVSLPPTKTMSDESSHHKSKEIPCQTKDRKDGVADTVASSEAKLEDSRPDNDVV
ncbi:balbiani ring protein 3-like isoform X1 [Schistocerca americana]|uniref:balbiani ring protein 3-like isoform X1 n=2 Tax=Schistocerca americana TaxID=7009 RepID=UPI001F4F8D7E|nr:balbiani ring protein 3-like isoform X1 [Schistocerca americana]